MRIARTSIGFIEVPSLCTFNIYTAGCSRHCEGCHNPELQDFDNPNATSITIPFLVDKINGIDELLDGVCWLGGEPTEQPDLVRFIRALKKAFPHKKQILYTGNQFEEVSPELKEDLDVIVDGPWQGKPLKDPETNQRIWMKSSEWTTVSYEQFKSGA